MKYTSRNAVYVKRKPKNKLRKSLKGFAKEKQKLHGAVHHNILLFIGNGFGNNTWMFYAEVVEQSEVKQTISKRKEMGQREMPACRSPSINVVGVKQITVNVRSDGPLRMYQDSPVFINMVPDGENNFIPFPVKRITKDKMALISFKVTSTGEKLHTAYFDPRVMNTYTRGSRSCSPVSTESLNSETQTCVVEECHTPVTPATNGKKVIPGTTNSTRMSYQHGPPDDRFLTTATPSSVYTNG